MSKCQDVDESFSHCWLFEHKLETFEDAL